MSEENFPEFEEDSPPVAWQPTEHRIRAFWRYFLVLFSPPVAGMMFVALYTIWGDYLAGKGNNSIWLLLFVSLILGGIGMLMLVGAVSAFRSRIRLEEGEFHYRSLSAWKCWKPQDIEGYRFRDGQAYLHVKGKTMPVMLALFDNLPPIYDWLAEHAVDLDQQQRVEESEEIAGNHLLGRDEESRQRKLETLQLDAKTLNGIAYVAAVAGFLNFAFFEQALIHQLCITLMILIPLLMLQFMYRNRGIVRMDGEEGSKYPHVLSGWLFCGMSIALISLHDGYSLTLGMDAWLWRSFFLALLASLIADRKTLKVLRRRSPVAPLLALAGYVFIISYWLGGSIYQTNILLDGAEPEVIEASVVSSRVHKEKFGYSYYLKLLPQPAHVWMPGETEIKVSEQDLNRYRAGKPVKLALHPGWLGIPWVEGVRPQEQK